jgi:DNA-binding PadR family transcriptional regulator
VTSVDKESDRDLHLTGGVVRTHDGGLTDETEATPAHVISRFELSPPRGFIFPAVLLALCEQPDYGYGLAPRLEEMHFGRVERPAIYRALAKLEQDGLVATTSHSPKARQSRRVYCTTLLGEQVLRTWMEVVEQESDHLRNVLHRYHRREAAWAGATTRTVSPRLWGDFFEHRRGAPSTDRHRVFPQKDPPE